MKQESASLYVVCSAGQKKFGIDCHEVKEVISYMNVMPLAGMPDGVTGVITYRNNLLPLIDLNLIIEGLPSRNLMSTRILIIHFGERLLALLAEEVLDTIRITHNELKSTGLKTKRSDYLAEISDTSLGIVQIVRVKGLLPKKLVDQIMEKLESIA